MATTATPKLTPIAVDTNVLLDLAADEEIVLDCIATIRSRIQNPTIVVLPTVIIELADLAENGRGNEKKLSIKALTHLTDGWKFQPVNFIPVGHGIVEQIGNRLRNIGLIPEEEVHDSFIVAEAALYDATMLISSDKHIKNIDQQLLKLELDASDLGCPLIASPWKIVHQFFPK